MAQTVKMKRSSVASKAPATTDLALGEVAINTYDGRLFLKKSVSGVETVVDVGNSFNATLGVANGGTGLTSLTAGYIPFGAGTSAFGNSANLFWDNTNARLGVGVSSPGSRLETYIATNPSTFEILSVVRNDNPGSGVAAIGFNVSSSALGEASSTKAGIGIQRSVANGGGALIFYNNNSGSAGSFTAADERMRIAPNGNVGIGTTSIGSKLTVNGNVAVTGSAEFAASTAYAPQVGLTNSAADSTAPYLIFRKGRAGPSTTQSGDGLMNIAAYGYDTANTAVFAGGITMNQAAAAATASISSQMVFYVSGATEAMRMNATGLVSIGTTSSFGGQLNVKSTDRTNIAYIGGATYAMRFGAGASFASIEGVDAATGVTSYQPLQVGGSYLSLATGGSERARITSGGDLGVGTTSPVYNSISNVRNGVVRYMLGDTSQAADKKYWDIVTTGGAIYFRALADADNNSTGFMTAERGGTGTNWIVSAVTLNTAGAERLRVNSVGNVGIFTTAPVEKLQIGESGSNADGAPNYISMWGSKLATNGVTSGIKFYNTNGNPSAASPKQIAAFEAARDGNNYGGALYFTTADTSGALQERARIDSSGNVLVTGGGGLGYGTGSGGAVTQATSKSTAVNLNKTNGQITMNNAALAGGAAVGFTLNNSTIASTDVVAANVGGSGFGAAYTLVVTYVTTGAVGFRLTNITGGSLSDAVVINFAVIKAVAA